MSGQAGTSAQSVSISITHNEERGNCSISHNFIYINKSTYQITDLYHPLLHIQSFLASRATLAAATTLSVGSIAYYTHLYGTIPFLPEASANTAAEDGLHPAAHPWAHRGIFESFDHASWVSVKDGMDD